MNTGMMMNKFPESITKDEINKLPLKCFEGKIHLVDTLDKLNDALDILENQPLLGFDTETKPSFKKNVKNALALLQLSTKEDCFLIRMNKVNLISRLASLLGNSNIKKAGVAISDDIKALQKLHEFEPDGFIELQQYVKDFGIVNNGLKNLVAIILEFRISKRQQTSNWESNILNENQLKYAATDAWVCYRIYEELVGG